MAAHAESKACLLPFYACGLVDDAGRAAGRGEDGGGDCRKGTLKLQSWKNTVGTRKIFMVTNLTNLI